MGFEFPGRETEQWQAARQLLNQASCKERNFEKDVHKVSLRLDFVALSDEFLTFISDGREYSRQEY